MTWQDNLKEVCGEEYLDSVEELITSLLKKQREICANKAVDGHGSPVLYDNVLNAPEPKE